MSKNLIQKVRECIDIAPHHWYHLNEKSLNDKSIIPDVTDVFYQTLNVRCGIEPKNDDECKVIRNVFHDVYLNEYNGIYQLDLDETYESPFTTFLPVKYFEFYKDVVTIIKKEK